MSNDDLISVLKGKSNGDDLVRNLENIKSKVEPLLSKITETFPDYTTHDIKHSKDVIKKLEFVIANPLKEKLNGHEIYFLLIATYLHDIGMVNFPELIKGDLKELKKDKEIREHIRENHHLRAEEFIVNNFKDLSIEDEHQARIIGRICRGHRKEDLRNKEIFKSDAVYKSDSINVPLLAAFLRIADELDLSFERAPTIIYEHVPPMDDISSEEWKKHLTIAGVTTSPEDPLMIKCSSRCENPNIHRALKRLETKINRELEDLPNHLYQYRELGRHLPRKFFVEIEAVGYKSHDFKFSLKEKEIVNLLMGEKLYKRKEESIRELLKNSVDGCKLRKELLKKREMGYTPKIVFEINSKEDEIVLTDNGFGMDEDIIERYFTKIGESFYKSTEFLEEGLEFSPVSELGIGILSCFMIADKIIVETKTDEGSPWVIEIDDLSDYFFVKEGKKEDVGTSITLFLKDGIEGKINLKDEVKYYASHIEFPIEVISGGEKEIIKDIYFDPDLSILTSNPDDYSFYSIVVNNELVEGTIAIIGQKNDKLGVVLTGLPWEDREPSRVEKRENLRLSNEGIFVGNLNVLPYYFDSDKILIDLNLKRNVLDLNIARNDVIQNDKFNRFVELIEKILIESIINYLDVLEKKCNKLNVDGVLFFNRFFYSYIVTWRFKRSAEKKLITDNFLEFVKKFYNFTYISKDGLDYCRYGDVLLSNKAVCIIGGLNDYHEKQITQIFSGCTGVDNDTLYLLGEYYVNSFATLLFENPDDYVSILSVIDMKKSEGLEGIIPKTWKLVEFRNYKTSRLIEFMDYDKTFLNRDNKFVDLLIKGKHIIKGDKKIAAEGLFRTMKSDLRNDFQKMVTKQKDILQWFVDAHLVNEDEISNYILTENDFPPHLFYKQ
jgi:hypothetical protein